MTRKAAWIIVALVGAGAPLDAQESATLRGVVVSESGERVSYAVVLLAPAFGRRFADESGAFAFTGVAPGPYRLLVRQVGFVPFDSAVSVSPATPALRITLRRVAVQLAAMTVASDLRCRNPGPPDPSADADLASVFEQLRLNAEHLRLLVDQYPFRYLVVRALTDILRGGHEVTRTDTLVLMSNARWSYAPGRVVTDDPLEWRSGVRQVHLPTLADFADSVFQNNHCFRLAGLDSLDGKEWVRVDFRAAEALRSPDVNGSAFLDPVSYQVYQTSVDLTRADRAASGVRAYVATATFRELRSNLIVIDRMTALTTLDPARARLGIVGRSELQRLGRVEFERPLP